MKRLWEKIRHRYRRIQIWFWMRSIERDLNKIDRKMTKAHKVDKS